MNADKLSFDRSRLCSDSHREPLLIQKKKKKLGHRIIMVLCMLGSFSAGAQTVPDCDLPISAVGSTGAIFAINAGSVKNANQAIDGDPNTKCTMAGFISIGFGAWWKHTTTLDGLKSGDVYLKCGTEGSLLSVNVWGTVTLTAYNGTTPVWNVNVGNVYLSLGLTLGNGTTGIIPAPNTQAYNRLEVKYSGTVNASVLGDVFSIYEVKRIPVAPPAPAVNGSGSTISSCFTTAMSYSVVNPSADLVYKWYDAPVAGTLLATGPSYTLPAFLPNGTNNVYVEAVTANYCSFPTPRSSARSVASVTVTNCMTISVKAFLQGAFNGTRHNDVTTSWANILKAKALNQPYNTADFGNYAGNETVPASIFTATAADNDVVDWVLLELKQADGTLADRRAALILENGDIVNTDKVSPVSFNASPGSYHLTVRHRNHLGLSSGLLTLAEGNNTFDFTTATDATLFGNATAFQTMNGKTLLTGGNANSNSNIRFNGPGNDRDAILAFLNGNESGMSENVYVPQDLNLDGTIRYNGPGNERDFLLLILHSNEGGFFQQQIK